MNDIGDPPYIRAPHLHGADKPLAGCDKCLRKGWECGVCDCCEEHLCECECAKPSDPADRDYEDSAGA